MKAGRPPRSSTEEDLIRFHLTEYYEEIDRNPTIRLEEADHIRLIEEEDERYRHNLKRESKRFNYDYYQDKFIAVVEFLTKVFERKKEREEREREKREFMDKFNK